jgi:hypothetical protein
MTASDRKGGSEKKLMRVKIETKGWSGEYEVENGFQAVKAFFKDVQSRKIGLDQVGLIGFWHRGDGEKIPFRIPPSLFKMGLIGAETLHDSLMQIGDFPPEDLMAMMTADSWMVEGMAIDRTRPATESA